MSVERVATNAQAQYLLSEIMQRTQALSTSQQQVASGKVSTTYAGIGNKTSALEAARASAARADAYQSATAGALNQVNLQDTELTQLSSISQQLQQALSDAAARQGRAADTTSPVPVIREDIVSRLDNCMTCQPAFGVVSLRWHV